MLFFLVEFWWMEPALYIFYACMLRSKMYCLLLSDDCLGEAGA
jgi:hypothetical protein